MPTLPLYTPTAAPDAWHRVRSPGGYETWYVDVEDANADRLLVVTLSEGFANDPVYLRRYLRYRRRPTRVAPPIPSECPNVCVAYYEHGELVHQSRTIYPPASFVASSDRPDVTIGPNSLTYEADGEIKIVLDEPHGRIRIRPRAFFLPHANGSAENLRHHRTIVQPLCDVDAAVHFSDSGETIGVKGRGYHEHRYGTEPLIGRAAWGRILLNDRTIVLSATGDAIRITDCDATGARELPSGQAMIDPNWERVARGTDLLLERPHVVESAGGWRRAIYDATWRGQPAVDALCEIIEPAPRNPFRFLSPP